MTNIPTTPVPLTAQASTPPTPPEKNPSAPKTTVLPKEKLQICLDKIRMNVIKTAETGVVNKDTIFEFRQKGDNVFAEYEGGEIQKGFLVGKFATDGKLSFSYCQIQIDGKIDEGSSKDCEVEKNAEGKITLTERFEWSSRPGEFGVNIFQEL